MNHFDYRNGVLHAEAVLPNQIRIARVLRADPRHLAFT
jgi:hypothetical protein